jgi:hypothetical protein
VTRYPRSASGVVIPPDICPFQECSCLNFERLRVELINCGIVINPKLRDEGQVQALSSCESQDVDAGTYIRLNPAVLTIGHLGEVNPFVKLFKVEFIIREPFLIGYFPESITPTPRKPNPRVSGCALACPRFKLIGVTFTGAVHDRSPPEEIVILLCGNRLLNCLILYGPLTPSGPSMRCCDRGCQGPTDYNDRRADRSASKKRKGVCVHRSKFVTRLI